MSLRKKGGERQRNRSSQREHQCIYFKILETNIERCKELTDLGTGTHFCYIIMCSLLSDGNISCPVKYV